MDKIQEALERHDRASQRGQFDSLWESVCEVLLPRRMGFTSEWAPGSQKTDRLFDTAPMLAARGLGSALDGLVKPKQSQWFTIESEDDKINRDDKAANWFHKAERELFRAIYHPKARWMQATGEADMDLTVIGNGFVLCTENKDRDSLLFRSHHMKDVFFLENSDGAVDTVHIRERLPARVAAQRWREENLGEKAKELLANNRGGETLKYLQIIEPRHDRDPRRTDSLNMPFQHLVIECDSEHLVQESGFPEFPGAAARWDTTSGEVYGRGPGTLALPDAQTCQQIKRTLLKAGHRAVDPPWIAARGALVGRHQNRPGGLTFFDAVEAAKHGSHDPIKQLESRAQLPFGLELLSAEREEVAAAFYRNILNLPIEGPQMTATEVIQRREEFIREIGSPFGRLETEYITPLVERSFGIMMRRSIRKEFRGPMTFSPPPDILRKGAEIRFKFSSPIDKAKRQIEATQMQQWLLRVLQGAEAAPDILDAIDFDAVVRIDAEANDVPPAALRSQETVAEIREKKAEEKAAMMNLQAGEQVASMSKDGGTAVKALADAMGGQAA